MNNKVYIANLTWLINEKRTLPLKLKNYAPLIAINGNKVFNGSSWSLLCYSFEIIEANKTKAYIQFLNTKAAPDILYEGLFFELFEGLHKVADGEVIEETTLDFELI